MDKANQDNPKYLDNTLNKVLQNKVLKNSQYLGLTLEEVRQDKNTQKIIKILNHHNAHSSLGKLKRSFKIWRNAHSEFVISKTKQSRKASYKFRFHKNRNFKLYVFLSKRRVQNSIKNLSQNSFKENALEIHVLSDIQNTPLKII